MFKREFKINLKSTLLWTSVMIIFFLVVFAVYPSITNGASGIQIDEMMKMFPPEMLKAFNMDIIGIGTVFGWMQTEGYMFLTLLGGIFASILGGTILVKEENDKTIEFLYSKPISRGKIVTSKILCGIVDILLFTLVIALVNFIGLKWSNDLIVDQFLWMSFSPLLLFFILFFVSLFFSTFMSKTKAAMGVGIGVTFACFLVQLIGNMGENLAVIKSFSPFEFVSIRYIIEHGGMDIKYVLIGVGIIAVAIIGTYARYHKKELV